MQHTKGKTTNKSALLPRIMRHERQRFLCQFVNELTKDHRGILTRQDDVMVTPVEIVVKGLSTRGGVGVVKVTSSSESSGGDNPTGGRNQLGEIEDIVNRKVEQKLAKFSRSSRGPLSAAVRRGGKRTGRLKAH